MCRFLLGVVVCGWMCLALRGQDHPIIQGITVQQPVLGVSIDADGLLSLNVINDMTGALRRQRLGAAAARLDRRLLASSPGRTISLRRLAETIQAHRGQPLPEEILCLAGLTRIEYVFLAPESQDILLVGPASNWVEDLAGRRCSLVDGRPTMLLEDLVAALRTFAPGKNVDTWVACSIEPTREGMEAYRQFQRALPARANAAQQVEIARAAPNEIMQRLGLADILVWGVPHDSHLASVMIEADYRMKLMAVGLEPAPQVIRTFIQAVEGGESGMQRWWLTPQYDLLQQSPDALALRLVGQGVQLNTEDALMLPGGTVQITTAKPGRAARTYAASFTRHYPTLARENAVFAQLQSVIDVLVMAAWLNKHDAWSRVGWQGGALLDASLFELPQRAAPKRVACVANAVWKQTTLVLPAGGGVSITPAQALHQQLIRIDTEGQLSSRRSTLSEKPDPDSWYWD